MLLNAKGQMLSSNNSIIRRLDNELIKKSIESDEKFWDTMDFQRAIIEQYKEQIRKIEKKDIKLLKRNINKKEDF